jgi:hypothetical protein
MPAAAQAIAIFVIEFFSGSTLVGANNGGGEDWFR